MNDMSLVLEFVQEAREYMDEVEPTLIEIYNGSDTGSVNAELINSVFRLFHSMKGSAGFLALTTVTSVTHEAETLLDRIRNGKLSLTVQITATLCKAIDLFREMLIHIEETGNDEGFDVPAHAIIAILKKHVAGEPIDDLEQVAPALPQEEKAADGKNLADLSFDALAGEAPPVPHSASELDFVEPQMSDEIPVSEQTEVTAENDVADALQTLQLSDDMRHGFVLEATEQLESAEQALLLVLDEANANSIEPLKDAFRYIHSFKGNCGFMGLVNLEHLSHTMETLLDQMRNGEISPQESNVGALLKLIDVLQGGVKNLEEGGVGRISGLENHIQQLNQLMDSHGIETKSVPIKQTDSKSTSAAVKMNESAAAVKSVPTSPVKSTAGSAASAPEKPSNSPSDEKKVAAEAFHAAAVPEVEHAAPALHPSEGGGAPTAATASKEKPKQDIRVDLSKLDILINLVGELVIAESMVTRCPAVSHVEDEYYSRAKHQLRRICDDLQDVAMSVRMIPLSATFRKMIRLVHDLATKSGKKIKLNLVGEETEVDKTVIEQIADPLVHIVRNSCDHGVEPPDDRLKAGKSETGTVVLEGRHEGGEVWITIKDDGRGLNRERILNKAIEKGLVGIEARDWPDERIFKLVFEPGFSTADKVTDISGRGVGMDVVKRNIEKLNGRIDISSKEGEGATFTLRIPLTLAIVDAMLVRVGTGKYMIPTLTIRESLVPTFQQVTITPEGREILRLRDEMVPVIRLYDVFCCTPGAEKLKDGILIVAEDSGRSFAFFVDEIIGQQQTVIKGLPDYIGEANGFSGCTILGDGAVSLIVDVGAVSRMGGSYHASPVGKSEEWA
ncbi:MAG: Hpt domain-containing protein [Thermoguttaceae bacterium]